VLEFKMPVQHVKGVGPKTCFLLNRISIYLIEDLLYYFPKAYEDRSIIKPVRELVDGEIASVVGEVSLIDRDRYTKTGKHITRIIIKCNTDHVACIWYNQRFVKKNFKIGQKYLFYGKISNLFGETELLSPQYESIEKDVSDAILPVYPLTKDLSQRVMRSIVYRLVNSVQLKLDEVLPQEILQRFDLCSISFALKNIHFPEDSLKIKIAERRIKFEELLILQLGLMIEKHKIMRDSKGIVFCVPDEVLSFISSLPFTLTNAQKYVISEILNDMKCDKRMNRLVQGDVGSGKTIVAAIALLNAAKNGYQGIMMAPTEILAYQHYKSLVSLFEGYGINIELLSAKVPKKQKEQIKEGLKSGYIDIIVGTHALIEEDVELKNPGLVITDEQHRFGVRQRALLSRKGQNPDVLVMTATPIPRTMALFIYGDLDISIINEMPPGRQKVNTYAVEPSIRQRVYNFVKKEIKSGRQAYIVCPLVDESDLLDAKSAVETAKQLEDEYLKGIKIGLLHGRMKPSEKDSVMENFYNGEIEVLVSTTVIEVGINVPNATVMVIEDAHRFGLSTLHQLRGRVGRGQFKSYCILISEMKSEISRKRMNIMRQISDGFDIAEEDMKLRGTGEFFGIRQHGLPELKLADIFRDVNMLKETSTLAKELIMSEKIYSMEYENLRMKVECKVKQKSNDIEFN